MSYNRMTFPLMTLMLVGASLASVHAATDNRDVVHDTGGHIVVNSFHNCVRTRWLSANDACAPEVVQAQPAPMPKRAEISREARTVYFGFNKAALTPEAAAKLNTLANNLKADSQVQQARIVGYADRIGTVSYNEKLSKRRAENVRNYLVSHKVINVRVADTRWLGDKSPATQCAANLPRQQLIACLQKDRRVEVEIDYVPQAQTRQ